MKAKITIMVNLDESKTTFEEVNKSILQLKSKIPLSKKWKQLVTEGITVEKIFTIEDDIEAIENLQYTDDDNGHAEFNEALERVIKFVKENK